MDIKSKKGVTLVEVVVAVAIMAIIIVPISLVFATAYSSFNGESDKAEAQKCARAVLYGKGLISDGVISYGVMGDLERSNATLTGDLIKIEDPIVLSNPNKGRSISITDGNGVTKKYSFNGSILSNETGHPYFDNVKSSNGRPVEVTYFEAEKVIKQAGSTDADAIKITVTVVCGKSGEITLQSSYRIPNIE